VDEHSLTQIAMNSKSPDNYSENSHILPYGSNVGAPAIVLPDTALFKTERGVNATNYFQSKLDDLNKKFMELKALAEDTERVYNSKYNFVPRVGHTYYLYWNGSEYLLSLIENWNKFEYCGSYQFNSDNVWIRMSENDDG
jgi:hypothetical protein